jgi:hypothetical protein
MAKQLESIEIIPGENGGHRVVHNFKRETSKKSGAMTGGVYIERPKSEEHLFGASAEGKVPPHIRKALNLKPWRVERTE